ncbi:MAG: CinA family nicotinamide mononucleotide deamidase-related protein [Ferruginibacter sp.]|nr:CinA family nicotinamide mononucleotide deamidase-related protein [Bacteroidota bacterium]MBX2918455.1 CinA family nicotinamide mononucleotide deamidase-related protein [Ferruginibacter sp.]MCB0708274.1 CinA family nicotinamide mononucleotide deamidase-related protein [Chitinophagaceae bacterium]MCC7378479.1 CinA family nicotinamide mononucleotide deamidase-related protein [Chitinophagaceae bacterium]
MQQVQASIITIGDELLIGQVIDTNSAWMAQQLNKEGIRVVRRVAVGDVWDEIWAALDEEQKHADIILITGGLGPTADDITKPLLCKYFNGQMIVHEESRQRVVAMFTRLKRPLLEVNLKQAEVPDVCTVLINKRGSAPGMVFNKDGKVFVSMPGVPHEMQGLMTDDVVPLLVKKFSFPSICHKTLLTSGIGESFLAELIKDFENALPAHIKLAYLPNYGLVRLRLTATGFDKEKNEKEIQQLFDTLKILTKDYLVTDVDEPMQNVIGKLLVAKGKTMCTAESCSGGYIAHLLTTIPGSSKFYDGSVISYSYQAKEDLLQVNKTTIETLGAVSEEVVIEMAKGALKNIKSDYVIAVSGIMGPQGGLPGKPVGTVWVAVGKNEKIETQKLYFPYDRMRNIQLTAANALNMLRKFILTEQ